MPFAGYKDFDACVAANSEKANPSAYCATIMRKVEKLNAIEKRTPGIARALRALAAAKRRNKQRMARGLKPIVEGKQVSPSSLSKSFLPIDLTKHFGPGDHPSGSPQTAHAGGHGDTRSPMEQVAQDHLSLDRIERTTGGNLPSVYPEHNVSGSEEEARLLERLTFLATDLHMIDSHAKEYVTDRPFLAGDPAYPQYGHRMNEHRKAVRETYDKVRRQLLAVRLRAETQVAKHAAPVHPGTGTGQDVHGGGGGQPQAKNIWRVTVEYGSERQRHRGRYTAQNMTREEAKEAALRYFANRKRTNLKVTNMQESFPVEKHGGPGDHANGSPQSVHGARGSATVPSTVEATSTQGGFTVDPRTGAVPDSGYAVALPGHELQVDVTGFSKTRITQIFRRYRASKWSVWESTPGATWGAWVDTYDGQRILYLDISIVVPDEADAIALGRHYNQLAIYDLANQTEIRLEEMSLSG